MTTMSQLCISTNYEAKSYEAKSHEAKSHEAHQVRRI